MPQPIEVRKVPLWKVSDASGLDDLINKGVFEADDVLAVIGKTEGNGGVNDYTRILADRAFREVLASRGTRSWDEIMQIPLAWSGGTDGVLSPHATVFAKIPADRAPATDEPRVSVGVAMSDRLLPEDIGRAAMIEKVAAGVQVRGGTRPVASAASGTSCWTTPMSTGTGRSRPVWAESRPQ
jgi:cyanuric acid amidohydrolase